MQGIGLICHGPGNGSFRIILPASTEAVSPSRILHYITSSKIPELSQPRKSTTKTATTLHLTIFSQIQLSLLFTSHHINFDNVPCDIHNECSTGFDYQKYYNAILHVASCKMYVKCTMQYCINK